MTKQLKIWQLIYKSLKRKVHVTLLYVLESSGSSPGRQGFFMAVNATGEMEGSIGGGIMEHKFVEMAKDRLHYDEHEMTVKKQVHDKVAAKNQSGMICSGEQTNFLYTVHESEAEHIENIITCLQQNKNGLLKLSPAGIAFSDYNIPSEDYVFDFTSEDHWFYLEKIGYKNHLYVIGGGHCSLAFTKVMRMLDFYIHLYEERSRLNTFVENNYVHEKTVLNNFGQLKDIIPSGEHNYVVVMTFGYRTDDLAVRSLLKKQFKYFGLLGSSKKIERMFMDYMIEGIDQNKLNRIHSPIGVPIRSQTPEEIAISIAAEIIQLKNEKQGF